jgi:hypothetical protein
LDAVAILHDQDFDSDAARTNDSIRARLHAEILRRDDYESVLSKQLSGPALAAGQNLYKEHSPAFFVVGYGATRRIEDPGNYSRSEVEKQRTGRYQRVAGLFESQVSLMPLSAWLPDMAEKNKGRFSQIQVLLNSLLPAEVTFPGEQLDRDYLFTVRRQSVPFRALSDGYRAYVGWICDLIYHVAMTCPSGRKIDENRGVVLVDEIDLHLHPIWQQHIIESVSKALPKLQFVFTTHSPIVATSLEKENIFVMTVDDEGTSRVAQLEERIFGKSADQALESTYFGMRSTRAPAFLADVQMLISQTKTDDPSVAFKIMDKVTGLDTREAVFPRKSKVKTEVRLKQSSPEKAESS